MANEENEAMQYCEELGADKNEHGVYIYASTNGHHRINLPAILQDYKEWLIESKIVKQT